MLNIESLQTVAANAAGDPPEKQKYQMIRLMPRLKWNREPMWAKNLRKAKDKTEVDEQVLDTMAWLACKESEAGLPKQLGDEESVDEGDGEKFDRCTVSTDVIESYQIDGMDDLEMWRPIKIYQDALITMIMKAFNRHHPVVFSPDLVYAYLVKGIAIHVKIHAHKMRKLFVNHTAARSMLHYENANFVKGGKENDWGDMFRAFAYEIRDQVQGNPVVPADLTFSTSTPVSEAHRQVLSMDTMKNYFKFKANTKCGIAAVILEGTPEDWDLVRKTIRTQLEDINHFSKSIAAEELDLSWWSKFVIEMLDNFVESYRQVMETGDCKRDLRRWWAKIYKYHGALESGAVGGATGWINIFYPYLSDNKPNPWLMYCLHNNMERTLKVKPPPGMFKQMKESMCKPDELPERPEYEIDLNRYPSYMNCIPFKWNYYSEELSMKALIGHAMLGMVVMDYREYPFGTMKLFPTWAVVHDENNIRAMEEPNEI